MKNLFLISATAVALTLTSAVGRAQTVAPTFSLACERTGVSPLEPLGDREGHAMSVSHYTCRVTGGPLDSGVLTGTQNWEWQGPNAAGLGGGGVVRHGKGALVYSYLPGSKINLKMDNGKVVGFTGSGAGRYMMATGAASAFANKTFMYTVQSTGFSQFAVDVTVE